MTRSSAQFTQPAESSSPSALLVVVAVVLGLAGLALVIAGAWLIALGGSWYYLVAGLGLIASALLLRRGGGIGLLFYAAVVLLTLVWVLWEVGFDWWPLAARGDVFFVIGLFLLSPWVARALARRDATGIGRTRAVLGVVLAAFLLAAVFSWTREPGRIEGIAPLPDASGNAAAAAALASPPPPKDDWTAYGGTGFGQRYSALDQITPANVGQLEEAWHFRTGDVRGQPGDPEETTFEVTPLKIGERLFLCTPHQAVIALNATTGEQIWRYTPDIQKSLALQHLTCRGLSYYAGSAAQGATPTPSPSPSPSPSAPAGECDAKLFMPTADGRVIALSPESGKPCMAFGGGSGQIDLWKNMPNVKAGSYYSTSPVVVTRSLIVVGGTVLDNVSTKETSGVIRAFDVNTGALVWNWDSGNPDETAPIAADRTYTVNSPNSWSISSVDEALGLVYVPTGNQPPDQWGGKRTEGAERYSSSVVALDLTTGRVRWSFQTVHHDLWDYDVPSQPSLIDLRVGSETIPALVQPTKQGELFVLDRRNGRPIVPVNERPAPQGAATGDRTAPTQPVSGLSFDPPALKPSDMWGGTIFDQLACRIAFHRLRYEGRFTPPSTQGSLIYPGNFGVFNWGSIAVDPQRQIAFTTPASLAFVSQLVPRADDTTLYVQGKSRPNDSLPALNENFGAPFAIKLSAFTSVLGLPCQAPPWGHVAGADLRSGKVIWMHKNGTVRDSSPLPLPFAMGVPNLGGPVMTAGGVAFLSGTLDQYVRGYDVGNGKELWRSRLPAGGQATPMTYRGSDGRQYVVVAAGGHGSLGTRTGDHVIAYALPKR
ncbi:quinoprotein glucose dehydrogenase [Variovorax boronicumulans]|uniref:membrane-bound PQQ-dependent dehydrogenase, glucose/quinate/shikimate family n=1 Tax=Variovorax boronicumulans TaxID=436515 RepID=UPI00278081C7|nr:membrane-bound PQQ-dependent dehydrogenase, glucose/quinate/shikimate family [Variovorax boronicumulans]MDP9994827.1 quinoprotein glucose dehydrogenase [Variovorax boronicumulans]MDQ0006201.1 quinoprotein glucose dehydrogenase [Variovorax boronicumulans]